MAGFWQEPVRRPRRSARKDGPMTEYIDRNALRRRRTGDASSAGKIWRALTQPHLIEEWLMKNDFKPVVGHRFNLRGDWGGVLDCEVLAVEPNKNAVLHLEFRARRCGLQSEERGDLYAHANEHGDPPAHGAVGLPAGSEAGLRRRQGGWQQFFAKLEQVLARAD